MNKIQTLSWLAAITSILTAGQVKATLLIPELDVRNISIPSSAVNFIPETSTTRTLIAQEELPETEKNSLERDIFEEINQVRNNPAAYADWLESIKQYYDGNLLKLPEKNPISTQEGVKAVDEAISFLRELSLLSKLSFSRGLTMTATDLVKAQESSNESSTSSNENRQLNTRISRYGTVNGSIGENISYGPSAQLIVMKMVVDDGVPNRYNRANLFNPDFQNAGIACGIDRDNGNMCVITYAEEYTEKIAEPEQPTKPVTSEETTSVSSSSEADTAILLSEQGVLEEGDTLLPSDGSLYDSYPLEGRGGQSLTIVVESQDFDTYVALLDANNNIIKENDDFNDENSNSALTITLPEDGIYYIIVNAYNQNGRGQYTLKVRE